MTKLNINRQAMAGMIFTAFFVGGCGGTDTPVAEDTDGDTTVDGDTDGGSDTTVSSLDIAEFSEGALASSNLVDCELSDGTAAQCYELVTVGAAKSSDLIGPFCPRTTTSTSDEGGVWLDGEALYEANGDFILNLPNIYGQAYPPADNWILYDENGDVRVTDTLAGCVAAARPDVDPEYQSYCVECALEDLEIDLSMTFLIPATPVVADSPGALTPGVGISLNGFQIAAQAPVSDILSNYTIAAFDDCGGHVNPNDGYHYHSATAADGCNSAGTDADGHPALIGYAMDGYGIYGPLDEGSAEIDLLDGCYGQEDEVRGYHYHAASAEKNEHIACFHGKTTSAGDDRPPRPE